MNTRIYPAELYNKVLSSYRIVVGQLSCPECFGKDIMTGKHDQCKCCDCDSEFEFKELLNINQVRDKKIDSIL